MNHKFFHDVKVCQKVEDVSGGHNDVGNGGLPQEMYQAAQAIGGWSLKRVKTSLKTSRFMS